MVNPEADALLRVEIHERDQAGSDRGAYRIAVASPQTGVRISSHGIGALTDSQNRVYVYTRPFDDEHGRRLLRDLLATIALRRLINGEHPGSVGEDLMITLAEAMLMAKQSLAALK
jgi:hypothetical protein